MSGAIEEGALEFVGYPRAVQVFGPLSDILRST